MKNPLTDFFDIEERVDGLYIKVTRQEKDRIRLDELFGALEAAVAINYDKAKITDVCNRAAGAFEKVGPLFEYYNAGIERFIECFITSQKASIKISPAYIAAGIKMSENVLVCFLKKKGIKHGINHEEIRRIYIESKFDRVIDIATATQPIPGQDGSVEFLIPIAPDAQPVVGQDGRVDYRNIKSFVSVVAKQHIAKKIPPTPGKIGMTVSGELIPSQPGKEVPLPRGRNTEISPDGMFLLAQKTGIIVPEGSILNVLELLTIGGDVDFSVGNIKYGGDILVRGNVLPGFIIEAEGSVHIMGEVESARIISRTSNVHVERGIIGKGDTFISAKTGMTIAFAQEATLNSEGHITVEKYLLHCDCTCLSLETKDTHGSIIGGHIKAEKSVVVGHLGSEKGIKTKVTLFDKVKVILEEKFRELLDLEKKLATEIGPIERQLRTKSSMMKKFQEGASDRQQQEIKKWIDAYNTVATKIKYVHKKTDELKKAIEDQKKKDHDGCVKVSGNIFHGVDLDIYDRTFVVHNSMSNKKFRLNKFEVSYDV